MTMMNLDKYKKIKLRNSCDRYGISHILANQFEFPIVPYCFANWIHGWLWDDELSCSKTLLDLIQCLIQLSLRRHLVGLLRANYTVMDLAWLEN